MSFEDIPERLRSRTLRANLLRQALQDPRCLQKDISKSLAIWPIGSRRRVGEVVIGAGLHAAILAANCRGRDTICLDQGRLPGGIFALANRPTFYLNSRNRPGDECRQPRSSGPLNTIIGGMIQPSEISMREYQTQTDFALAIAVNLACFIPWFRFDCQVVDIARIAETSTLKVTYKVTYLIDGREYQVLANRVIAATGLGQDRVTVEVTGNESRILTFSQFLRQMGSWSVSYPLRGMKRVAIIGAKDSGKVVAEYLLGLGPQPGFSSAAEDFVEKITWIGQNSLTKEEFERCERSRYAGLGRSFPRSGQLNTYYRIEPVQGRATRVSGRSTYARVDWMGPRGPQSEKFDYVFICTGFENLVGQLFAPYGDTEEILLDERPVARRYIDERLYIIGPAAELTPTSQDEFLGVPENVASAFRYAERTASFAKLLVPSRLLLAGTYRYLAD